MDYTLDQTSRLALSGLLSAGHPETCEPLESDTTIVSRAAFPLPRHVLTGGIPCPPRQHWMDQEQGDTSPELDESDEEEYAPRYGEHVLPSMRDRASVSRELRAMGFTWGE